MSQKARVKRRDPVRHIAKPIVFVLALTPALWLTATAFGLTGDDLGADPIETLLDQLGILGLRFVLIGLAITPLRKLTGFARLAWFRRMMGLFGAFYVSLHFLVYLLLDQALRWSAVVEDVLKRPFITLGMLALLLLLAMAATSTLAARRALGKRWQQLHYGAYAVGILGVWHFWWQVKKDITEPLIYAAVLALLLGLRLYWHWQQRARKKRTNRHRQATPHGAG